MKEIWTLGMLLSGSVMDIKKRALPRWFLLVCAAGSLALLIWFGITPLELLPALLPGLLMLAIGKLTGCIGTADGLLMLMLGALYGLSGGGEQLMYALLAAAVAALFLIGSKRAGRKDSLPFVPFLLLGFILAQLRIYLSGG